MTLLRTAAPLRPRRACRCPGRGYASSTREGPGFDFEDSAGDGSFRYGLGGQVFFDEANGVRATWTRWDEFETNGIDADVFVISYVRRFGGAG